MPCPFGHPKRKSLLRFASKGCPEKEPKSDFQTVVVRSCSSSCSPDSCFRIQTRYVLLTAIISTIDYSLFLKGPVQQTGFDEDESRKFPTQLGGHALLLGFVYLYLYVHVLAFI